VVAAQPSRRRGIQLWSQLFPIHQRSPSSHFPLASVRRVRPSDTHLRWWESSGFTGTSDSTSSCVLYGSPLLSHRFTSPGQDKASVTFIQTGRRSLGNSRISLGSRPRRLLPSENEIWTKTGGHRSFPVRVISRSQVSARCNKRERGQKRAEGTRRGWRVANVQPNQTRSDRNTRSTESRFGRKRVGRFRGRQIYSQRATVTRSTSRIRRDGRTQPLHVGRATKGEAELLRGSRWFVFSTLASSPN